jgi:hypothetical protein
MKRYRGTQSGQQMAGRGVRIWNELWKSAAPPYFKTKSPETQRRRGWRRLLVQGWATSPGFAAPHRTIANFRVVRASAPASLVRGLKERSGEAPSLSLWARLWVGRGNVARHQLCQSIKELLGRSMPPPNPSNPHFLVGASDTRLPVFLNPTPVRHRAAEPRYHAPSALLGVTLHSTIHHFTRLGGRF